MRRLVLGTAGHIDHGKTALVHALTGTDTDRLPDEKRRGITIDIGFARLPLGDELELDVVDVPGHEAFIRNMLAGATGIDLALVVIAADEGAMPQTLEHLDILRLLGIRRGVFALTKCDTVDEEWLALAREDAEAVARRSTLHPAPVITLSARTGQGLDDLRAALRAAAATVQPRTAAGPFRMPIDRVFTVRGTGTVVTGTVWSGSLSRDQQVAVEPGGLRARVRELERHGEPADRVRAGERAAVALAGVDRAALGRGHNLVANAPWQAAELLTVLLQALDDGPPIRTRQRVRLHLGTASVPARLAIPTGLVEPGTQALAQLLLEGPIIARAGDRAVLRAWSPLRTIGGVLILEPFPQRRKRLNPTDRVRLTALAQPDAALPALLELAGPDGVSAAALPLLLPDAGGTPPASGDDIAIGSRVVHRRFVDTAATTVLRALDNFHAAEPIAPGADRERLRREAGLPQFLFEHIVQQLMQRGRIEGRGPALARPDHLPAPAPQQEAALQRLSTIFDEAGIEAPDLDDLPADLAADPALPAMLRHLETAGTLQRIAPGRWAATAAVARAIAELYEQLPAGQQLAIADFRDVLRISRRHLLPFLEYLDTIGVTARTGDRRRLDPMAPAARPAVSSTAASSAAPEP